MKGKKDKSEKDKKKNEDYKCDLEILVEKIKNTQRKVVLVVGAGCSVSAGIPLARDLIEDIKRNWPETYKKATEEKIAKNKDAILNYNEAMKVIDEPDRSELLNKYIKDIKINWAHLCIGQLFKNRIVDRIITTNFDPLILRSCALLGVAPAVYDLASTTVKSFNANAISPTSVFYLHGQHTGFVKSNTPEEINKVDRVLRKTIKDSNAAQRLWIVIGSSGESDHVLEALAKEKFSSNLYWLVYEDKPSNYLTEKLFSQNRSDVFYIPNCDADATLQKIVGGLGYSVIPEVIEHPIKHAEEQRLLIKFETGGALGESEQERLRLKLKALTQVSSAAVGVADTESAEKIWALLFEGKYQRIIERVSISADTSDEIKNLAAWAYTMQGIASAENARAQAADNKNKAEELWAEAGENYAKALEIKPVMHEAYLNCGNALSDHARALAADNKNKAEELWAEAGENYAKAVEIKPDYPEAYYNWGNALADHARALAADNKNAAKELWAEAYKKYAKAVEIKHDYHEAYYNWGHALAAQALAVDNKNAAKELWTRAYKKYAKAVEIKPDKHQVYNTWGVTLAENAQALAVDDKDAAKELWAAAGEKYAKAVEIKPDKHEAYLNWGAALTAHAQALVADDKDAAKELWTRAYKKYAKAVEIKPDYPEAYYNWGFALDENARALAADNKDEAKKLWHEAYGKYAKALEIKPDYPEAYNNWGIALAKNAQALADGNEIDGAKELWAEAYGKYAKAVEIKPDYPEAYYNWGFALAENARTLAADDKDAAKELWTRAYKKYAKAVEIKPSMHEAYCSWGGALVFHALTLEVYNEIDAAKELWAEAGEKYAKAVEIKPYNLQAYFNWGRVLLAHAALLEKNDDVAGAQKLWEKAEEVLLKIPPDTGMAAYHLACVYARQGKFTPAMEQLKRAQYFNKLPTTKDIMEDEDLAKLRESAEFKDWWESRDRQ